MPITKLDLSDGLEGVAAQMLQRLAESDRLALQANLVKHGSISLGTMCSGTDVCAHGASACVDAFNKQFGLDRPARLLHRYSCEIKQAKQAFILAFSDPDNLFNDCTCMHQFRCHDVKSGSLRPVPAVNVLVAGFACTDVSHMNARRKDARGCINTKSKRTGSTFGGVSDYCRIYRPQLVILENVQALDDRSPDEASSNAQQVVNVMEGLGYIVMTKTLTPRDYGVPHRRSRYWFLCMLVSDSPLGPQDRARWDIMASNASQIIDELAFDPALLDEILMKPGSRDLAQWLVARQAAAKAQRDKEAPASATGKAWITVSPHVIADRFLRFLQTNAARILQIHLCPNAPPRRARGPRRIGRRYTSTSSAQAICATRPSSG